MMTNKEAIEMIESMGKYLTDGNPIWKTEPLKEATDMAIKALEASAWIPVEERLPDENGTYIVSLEDAVYPWATFHNGKWFMLSEDHMAREFGEYEVFAWMPLPDPYREDGEDDRT